MNHLFYTLLELFWLMIISIEIIACPKLPKMDFKDVSIIEIGPTNTLISYFEASKKGDAKTASNLIDYDEWARDMNLEGEQKKQWIDMHRGSLQEDYDLHKKEGSSKNYKILESNLKKDEATFKVSQERTSGKYIWEVKLIKKQIGASGFQWRIKGFYLKQVEGNINQVFIIED